MRYLYVTVFLIAVILAVIVLGRFMIEHVPVLMVCIP